MIHNLWSIELPFSSMFSLYFTLCGPLVETSPPAGPPEKRAKNAT